MDHDPQLTTASVGHSGRLRQAAVLGWGALCALLTACGGADPAEDLRRSPLAATATTSVTYQRDDLYRFFAVAFGAAPGVTYMGQLVEAADAGMSIKAIVNVFTTKPQFLETYPTSLTNQEYAQKLVDNVVGTSASSAAKAEAVADIVAALSLPNWTRGDITYAIFNNLAQKSASDLKWAATAKKMANQVTYAKHYTETMKVDTIDLMQLRAVVTSVTEASSTSGTELSTLIQNAVQTAVAQSRNRAPLARATAYRPAVQAGSTVQLDGSRSFDFEGSAITYAWKLDSRPAGSAAALSSPNSTQPTFVADVPGQYVATLTVNDGASGSKPARAVVTALAPNTLTAGQSVVASLNTKACGALSGCSSAVLSDFMLTFNQCTITKVGAAITLSRSGIEPITVDFDGDVVDRAAISGKYLVIGMRGRVATDQVNIEIDKDTGLVAAATGSATAEGVSRTIDCTVIASGTFPATAAVPAINSVAELLKSLDPRDCRSVSNGVTFSGCSSSAVPDFSLNVGTCTLAKAGDTLSVSQAGGTPISAKLNGDSLDVMGEAFDLSGTPLGYVLLEAVEADLTAGSQQSISVRIAPLTMTATVSARDLRKGTSTQVTC